MAAPTDQAGKAGRPSRQSTRTQANPLWARSQEIVALSTPLLTHSIRSGARMQKVSLHDQPPGLRTGIGVQRFTQPRLRSGTGGKGAGRSLDIEATGKARLAKDRGCGRARRVGKLACHHPKLIPPLSDQDVPFVSPWPEVTQGQLRSAQLGDGSARHMSAAILKRRGMSQPHLPGRRELSSSVSPGGCRRQCPNTNTCTLMQRSPKPLPVSLSKSSIRMRRQ